MTSLSSGTYTITNIAHKTPLGGEMAKGPSLPRPVVSLETGEDAPRFQLEVQSDGTIIKFNGVPTVVFWHKIYASPLPKQPAEAWRITPVEDEGPDTYVIETHDGLEGWATPKQKPGTQVYVWRLHGSPTDRYPRPELWRIVRVSDE